MLRRLWPVVAVAVAMAVACCTTGADGADGAGWSRYAVETTVVLSEPTSAPGRPELAGYRLRGKLAVHETDAGRRDSGDETLLAFHLQEMQLLVRGAEPMSDYVVRGSVWDGRDDVVYAAWEARAGRVLRVLHARDLPRHVLDHARALVSLFQYTPPGAGAGGGGGGGERNETDVSGECAVLYEPVAADVFRKVKRRCEHDAAPAPVALDARRVARYTLAATSPPRHLAALLADEVVTVRVADLAVKARSLHALTLLEHRPAPPPGAADPPPGHYVEATLAMPPLEPSDPDDELTVEEAVREFGAALEGQEAGGGGSAEGVAALLRLLPALQAASADALAALLRADRPAGGLRAVCGALGLAGTAAAAAAVRRAELPEPLVREYLAGLGVSLAPHAAAVADALALAAETRSPSLGDAALLAAAAASSRAGDAALATRVRDRITRTLARCKEESCRRVRVAALGNTRAPEAVETLVAHAEGGGGGAGQAALAALGGAPRLQPAHLGRLAALVGNESRPLEERAAALDLLAERETRGAALPLRTAGAWRALHARRGPAAGELRRLLAQRVAALAARRETARRLLAALPAQLRGWDAPPGASTVLVREPGWAGGGWRVELDSRQVTERGLLRRGRVALDARDADDAPAPLLAVELWTRGLAALAGADDDAATDETMAAGLGLAVAGVALPDIDLFEGQGELVGHIWAGTGSADTRVLRAAWPAAAWRGAVPLAGGVTLGVRAGAALAAALDARVSVSLWQRAARGALVLRAAAAARLGARLAPPTGVLHVEARAAAAPRLRIHADLDFYDGVTLCVRAATAAHEETRDTTAESRQGARDRRVRRARSTRVTRPGRTLSLGRENDAACRTLRSADDDDGGGGGGGE